MTNHTVKSYDAELAELDRITARMGGLAETQLADAIGALTRRDPALARSAVSSDRAIDVIERELQERIVGIIAKRQPMANDLRQVMTVLKIAGDLERIGDLAKSIAKSALEVSGENQPRQLIAGLKHMSEVAHRQLKDVLDAYSARDAAQALEVWQRDAGLDALFNSVFRELLTFMMEDSRNIGLCTHLLIGAKNMERIGDHTTNIAENVVYLVTGEPLTGERPKADETPSLVLFEPAR